LTGRVDIAGVLFQNANMDVFTNVFRGDAVSDFFNRIAADAVRTAVLRLKRKASKIHVLEIGAGTGGTTVGILEALSAFSGLVEFCFTDISLSFVRNAQRRFRERYPWIEYRALNIEEDLSRQGFEPHRFDIVVAANVLHDTRDIEFTLEQTRRLLKPGGLLILNEYTSVKDCLSFSGALLHGWWLFEDPDRRLPDSCLLSVPQWHRVLERTGFAVAQSFVLPTQRPDEGCSQSVMLCDSLPIDAQRTDDNPAPLQASSDGAARGTSPDVTGIVGTFVEQDVLTLL